MKSTAFALAICAPSFLLGACQYSPEMTERSLAYNQAVAVSTNEQILLNIVRAGEREPRYFTRFGANQAASSLGATLTPTLSFDGFKNGSFVPAPTASTGNTVTLDNLDDQKYQLGANAPIDNTTVAQYWSEGLQPDVLALLFIDSISIPTGELASLSNTVKDFCGLHSNKYCIALPEDESSNSLSACIRFVPRSRRGSGDYAIFVNDPAWNSSNTPQPEQCFVTVMRALLAVGLHPTDGKSTTKVAERIPDSFTIDPRFREKLIQQSLTLVTKDDDPSVGSNENYVTKKGDQTTFELESSSAKAIADYVVCHLPGDPDLQPIFDEDARRSLGDIRISKSKAANLVVDPNCKYRDSKKEIALDDLKISIHVRSFEGVIYFLGEIVRAEAIDSSSQTPVAVVGRAPWASEPQISYEEPFFVVNSGAAPPPTAPVTVLDDHRQSFWIPAYCQKIGSVEGRPKNFPGCSMEYPDNESLTVLTIVDQLWGLQKEHSPASTPQPTINVGK
jgi:hypothetical protein